MRSLRIILCLMLTALALPSLAFERPFPVSAKSGALRIVDYPLVALDGKQRNLSGGARIWSADNLTVVPNALGNATYAVRYTEDIEGAIDRVWVLTDEEIAALPPAPRRFTLFK